MPRTVLFYPVHLVVMVKAEPSISAFKRLITIVSRLMDLQAFKRASLSCSEEKLAPYNEYVSSALNIFSETKLLLSVVALVQVFVLLNTPSKDEMDTMTIPWILLRPEGALGLWDSMRYSHQMPRCLAHLKCSCTNWSATVLELRTTYAPICQTQNFLHPKIGLAINCPTTNTTVKPRDQASPFWGARAANHGGFQGQGQRLCASLAPITRISIWTPKASFWGTEVCSLWAWDPSIDRLSHAGRLYTWEQVLGRKGSSGLLFFQRRASRRNLMLGGRASKGRLVRQPWRVGGMWFRHVAQGSVGRSFLERLPWRNGCHRRKMWGGCCQVEVGEGWEWSFALFGDCIQDWLGSRFCGTAI